MNSSSSTANEPSQSSETLPPTALPLSPPSPTTTSTSTAAITCATEIPTHNLFNLTLIDPPQYGWTAAGGIINLLEPHEKARRKSTRNAYLQQQEREQKEKEKEKIKMTEVSMVRTVSACNGDGVGKDIGIGMTSKEAETANFSVTIGNDRTRVVSNNCSNNTDSNDTKNNHETKKRPRQQNQEDITETATISTDNFTSSSTTVNTSTYCPTNKPIDDNHTPSHHNSLPSIPPSPSIGTRNQGNKIPSTDGEKKRKRKKRVETLNFSALILVDENDNKNGYENNSNHHDESKSNDNNYYIKDSNIDITTSTTTTNTTTLPTKSNPTKQKVKLNPYIYHRGIENQEPRDENTGVLLCPTTQEMDTNHDWEPSPNSLKFTVHISFPLVDTDGLVLDVDDDDNNKDHYHDHSGHGGNFCYGISGGGNLEDKLSSFDHSDQQLHQFNNSNLDSNSSTRGGGGNTGGAGLRRNARRSSQNKKQTPETLLTRRLKREAKIKSLPHYHQDITWDLSNIDQGRTPLIYASDVAVEYGLSMNQMLDLAGSIQEQIDDHVRTNLKYKIPISAVDPLDNPRKEGSLVPPKYHIPKILYGGHGATNIASSGKNNIFLNESTDESDSDLDNVSTNKTKSRGSSSKKGSSSKNRRSGSSKKSGGGTRKSSSFSRPKGTNNSVNSRRVNVGGTTVIKYSKKHYDLASKDNLPTHDYNAINVEGKYIDECLIRLKAQNREMCNSYKGETNEDGDPMGMPFILKNHNCHICHTRRPECVIFPCGNARHGYCDLHCTTRLGFRVANYKDENLDSCPICSLQCICSKCRSDLTTVATNFKKECIKQKVENLKDVAIDDILALKYGRGQLAPLSIVSRQKVVKSKRKVHKRSRNVKHSLQKVKPEMFQTPQVKGTPSDAKPSPRKIVAKIPAYELPNEICNGENLDPSLEDDYRTEFTPDGCRIREDLPVQNNPLPADIPMEPSADGEDGNVEFCLVCQQSGDLICCEKCPRSFHPSCLQVKESDLPDDWECPRCLVDCTVQKEDELPVATKDDSNYGQLAVVYQLFEDNNGREEFWKELMILSKILNVVKSMINYDFGNIFAAPVSVKDVPDYLTIIKRPMDLGTIVNNIMKGVYAKNLPATETLPKDCNIMEHIILETLKDIEQVWHNCFLYNREGTSYHKMAKVMSQKYIVKRQLNIDNDLNDYIRQKLGEFVSECKQCRFENAKNSKKGHKPWIPFSKNQIQVNRGFNHASRKSVAVFDPDTNLVVKQYSSLSSSFSAVNFLHKKGFDCELSLVTPNMVKLNINKCAMDPSIKIFGYRWVLVDDLRNGNFVLGKKIPAKPIIRKINTGSNDEIVGEFDCIDAAYKDWKKKRGSTPSLYGENSLDIFVERFLDGKETIDGLAWNRIVHNNEELNQAEGVVMKLDPEDCKEGKNENT